MKVRRRLNELFMLLIPDKFDDVISIVMNLLRDETVSEAFSSEVFKALWSCRVQTETVLHKLLNLIEELIIVNKVDEAKTIAFGLSRSIDENLADIRAEGLTRLLRLYHLSVEITKPQNKCFRLKKGFENALIKIFSVMKVDELTKLLPKFLNLTFETNFVSELALKEFSYTIKFALVRLSKNKIDENLVPEIFEFLLSAMSLACKTKSALACEYLAHLFDHFHNSTEISWPKIFYNRTLYKIKMPKTEDESATKIIENYRELLQSSFLSAIKLHGCTTTNLCAIFKVICMIIVSIPSSCTFTTIITMLMKLQTHVLDDNSLNLAPYDKNRIHACIISIMTLICWVTRAKSLNKYVHEIVRMRFCHAPHLNPPLQKFYEYEDHHHELGYKEELFLDKWEVRYCLWNRHRLDGDRLRDISDSELVGSAKKKSPGFLRMKIFRRKSDPKFFNTKKFSLYFDADMNKM